MELDNLAAETAATMTTDHPDYAVLAARLAISNLHKETKKHFSGNSFLVNYRNRNLLQLICWAVYSFVPFYTFEVAT